MKHVFNSLLCLLITAALLNLSGCGGGGGGAASQETIQEPDTAYTGSDCSCGRKTSTGSGMTFSVSNRQFPKIKLNEYVKGEILVKFREGTNQYKVSMIINSAGHKVIKTLSAALKEENSLIKRVKINDGDAVENEISFYEANPDVEYAEPNYIYRAMNTVPDDTDFNQQWGLNNSGQSVNDTSGTSNKDIDAPEAWDKITNCSNVIVAVLDTGINYNHRDLSANMWDGGSSYPNHGYDFVDSDNDPMDFNGHGTHCAGIIGAHGNDATGLTGVCWQVKLMAVRVLDASGGGTLADIANGIKFAVDQGAHIISASLGGSDSSTLKDAINYARANGVIIVAAAGNESTSTYTYSYPAAYGTGSYNYDNIIAVAAVDQDGNLAGFSNYGTWVDIAAPGVNIISTWPGQHVVTTTDFSSWTLESGWGTGTYTYTSGSDSVSIHMLTNPSPFGGTNTYKSNQSSMAYRNFDLNIYGADSAILSFYADINTESDYDGVILTYNPNGGRPDPSIISNFLLAFSGNTGGIVYAGEYDLTSQINNDISLGFYFVSDYSTCYSGVGIGWFDITRLYLNTTACMFSDGTSMAAPHVSGAAAMAIQRYINNKGNYTRTTNYLSIINAVYSGAESYSSLNTKVAGNRMLNLNGMLTAVDAL